MGKLSVRLGRRICWSVFAVVGAMVYSVLLSRIPFDTINYVWEWECVGEALGAGFVSMFVAYLIITRKGK
jgi:hypothetical protein